MTGVLALTVTMLGEIFPSIGWLQGVYPVAVLVALTQVVQQSCVHHGSVLLNLKFSALLCARCVLCALFAVIYAKLSPTKIELLPENKELLGRVLLRGCCGNISGGAIFVALTYAPVPVVLVIFFCSPWIS